MAFVRIKQLIQKNWFWLNIVLVILFLIYQLIKNFVINISLSKAEIETPVRIDVFGLFMIIFGLFTICITYKFSKKLNKMMQFVLIAFSYFILAYGYIIQKDPNLEWIGSDVAWTNYWAAQETVKFGPYYIINTWNARANPYEKEGYDQVNDTLSSKKITMDFIEKYNLFWIIGDKWNTDNNDYFVDNNNNRPFSHPPLAPIIMGLWLFIIPFGRWSVQIFMILLNIFSLVIVWKCFKNFNKSLLQTIIAFITSPVLILYTVPSAEQLTMLLLGISVLLLINKNNWTWVTALFAGIFAGLAFYTKFTVGFYIFFQTVFLLIYIRKIKWRYFIAYISGIIIVAGIFTILGYYFWLTYFTGKALATVYAINHPISLFKALNKLLYFGPPLLLIIIYIVFNNPFKEFHRKLQNVYFPLVFGILVFILFMLNTGTYARYLVVFGIAFLPFILFSLNKMQLAFRDIIIIPLTNILCFLAIIYF